MSASVDEHGVVKEIDAGALGGEFGQLLDCDGKLPQDKVPQVLQFIQFALFEAPRRITAVDPQFLIVHQGHAELDKDANAAASEDGDNARTHGPAVPGADRIELPAAGNSREVARLARQMLEALATPGLPPPTMRNIGAIRKALVNRQPMSAPPLLAIAVPGPEPSASDNELLTSYRRFVTGRRQAFVRSAIEQLLPVGHELFNSPVIDPVNSLTAALDELMRPAMFQPIGTTLPVLALCLTYEQVWQPLGYTRGELLSTISLAPGEQLTIETHLWDKSTAKSEQELSQESELRSSEKLTQRDSLSVVQEYTRKQTVHVDASLRIGLPIFGMNVGGNVTDELQRRSQETKDQVREGVAEASQSLKETRKIRIEISRETGREDKQTQTISNTNRCHALNCHYFEVVANYAVTTRLASVSPCVLLANAPIYVTPAWVLCYQDVLTKALLDKVFLPGFDAARTLRIQELADDLRKQQEQSRPEFIDPGPDRAAQLTDAILQPGRGLLHVAKEFSDAVITNMSGIFGNGLDVFSATVVTLALMSDDAVGYLIYSGAVSGKGRDAVSQLDTARSNTSPFDALKAFFGRAAPDDFRPAVVPTTIEQGLIDAGMWGGVAYALLKERVLEKPARDLGLIAAVQNAWDTLHIGSPAPAGPAPTDPAAQQAADAALMALATAQADFNQLKCHIEANLMHYAHAVWQWEDADQRLLRMQGYGPILAAIDNVLLGFLADRAAYPLTDLTAADGVPDLQTILDDIRNGISNQHDEPILVTHPTPGTVVETILGECDACEPYIEQSRLIDLRHRRARADQEVEEARRRRMRLDKQPPDLSDFIPIRDGRVVINVDTDTEGEQEPS